MSDGFEDSINFDKKSRFYKPTLNNTLLPDEKLIQYYQTRSRDAATDLKFPGLFQNTSRNQPDSDTEEVVESICRLNSDFDFWRATTQAGLEVVQKRALINTYTPVLMHAISNAMLEMDSMREKNTLQKRAWDQYTLTR